MLDEERKLLFDLNVLDEVNDRFGSLEAMGGALMDKKDGAKTLRWLLTQMLNEGADDDAQKFTEHQVGKLVHAGNMVDVRMAVLRAMMLGNRGTTDKTEENDDENDDVEGNVTTGEMN